MASNSKLGDLDITQDELKRLENALKDENFRKLFCEYAEEISDPENRRRYEEEIAQMERERGMDVTFVRPEPGYVLKTSVDGEQKAFINISKSDKIDKPFSEKKQNNEGKSGLMWHIPHSFAPPREDHDKHKKVCQVYDFVIHPDTYRMAESNVRFKKLVEDTAMDGVEKQFQVKLDRKNIKCPKMQFKGTPTATVIRSRNASGPQPEPDASGMLKDMPYPYDNKPTLEKMKEREQRQSKVHENKRGHESSKTNQSKEVKDDATIPKYSIIHRSEIDMQEYRNAPDAKPSTRPRELVIKIELPLLKSAAQANLDIFEKRLSLESSPPAEYKLDLTLPYPVDDSKGSAKFDKQKRTLIVTLPVVLDDSPSVPSFISDAAENEQETNGISADSSHKGNISADRPLIEVLSNGTDSSHDDLGAEGTQQDAAKHENGETVSTSISKGDGENHYTAAVSYSLPEFSFTQDTETVSFVLKVKNVAENSIKQKSPSDHEIDFICTSQGEGGFPLHFRLFLRFAENCRVVPEHCTVDVTAENVVLLLLKERGSRGLWDQFWTGLDSDNLEEHLFLTTSNLQQQLQELDESSTEMGQTSMPGVSGDAPAQDIPNCSLEVTAMDEKKLTIKISPSGKTRSKKREEEEDEEYDPPSSAEIEVVHSRPNPLLHGILKQHSISESSEEVTHDHDSAHSSNEENDDLSPPVSSPGKRHTVSFSEHIDKATYKSSASVNSMKTALKSKRKRQRKWEEKMDKSSSRRRHNSAGSEGSSDDHMHNMSDSHSISEEEAGEERKSLVHQQDVEASAKKVLDFRTKPCESIGNDNLEKETNPNSGMENHENVSGSENLRETEGAEVTSFEDKGSSITNTRPVPTTTEGSSGEITSPGSSRKGGSIADKIKSKLAEENSTEDHVEDSDDEEGEDGGDKGTNSPDTRQSGQGSSSTTGDVYNEHRTECAFQFSNEVMFDLDVE